MKTLLTRLAALLVFTAATAARAGTFSTTVWTNDASTGLVSGQTLWAYHFGATTATTVNGVSVTGLAGPTASNANFDLTGTTSIQNNHSNNLTMQAGTGSAVVGKDFVYGGSPATITVKGLTAGRNYTVSMLSVAWQTAVRPQTISSAIDSLPVDQQQFDVTGQDVGIRIDYSFTAEAPTRAITITPKIAGTTFHLYGLALRQIATTSYTVTNTNDTGTGSLRKALADAATTGGAATITFEPGLSGATITLNSEIVISSTTGLVTVDATGLPAGLKIIAGPDLNRFFTVNAGKSLALNGLTFSGGQAVGSATSESHGGAIANFGTLALKRCTFTGNTPAGSGGAILNQGGTLTLNQCVLTGNQASHGGAIYQDTGTTTLLRCTLSGNQAGGGGAITNWLQGGTLTLTQCTLSGNQATANFYGGGAINIYGPCTLALTHCTFANNQTSGLGGGLHYGDGVLTLTNNIFTGNTATQGGPDLAAFTHPEMTIVPAGVNYIGNPANSTFTASTTILTATGGPINLGTLANNGGPMQTRALLAGSVAINATTGSAITADQRGFALSGAADIGAFEFNGADPLTVTSTSDSGAGSLRQALSNAAAIPGVDTVTFASGFTGPIVFSSEIAINDPTGGVIVDATGLPAGVTIDGGAGINRIFYVPPGISLALAGLTLTGGNGNGAISSHAGNGSAILNYGTLFLDRCTLSGNSRSSGVGGSGGAIMNDTGTLTLRQCTLSGNIALNGGAIHQTVGTLALIHCTLSGNQSSGNGGGIHNQGGTLTLTNCIVAGNGSEANIVGNAALLGTNLISGATPLDPMLAPLGNYGGPAKTMIPLPNSPAIDAAAVIAGLTTDQRGKLRNLDGNSTAGAVPDIGAVEVSRAVVTSAVDELFPPTGLSLRRALSEGPDLINFATGFPTLIALGSQLEVASPVIIDASSVAGGLIVNGSRAGRVFHIAPGVNASFVRLRIANGLVSGGFPGGYGGGVFVEGTLLLTECILTGNTAFAGGAAGVTNSGTLTLRRSTVNDNAADYGGGIQNEGTLVCESSTLALNTATLDGGAVSSPFGHPVTLKHCTVSVNSAATGGGVAGTVVAIENSIVTGNTASASSNISGIPAATGVNLVGVNALLGPLLSYGGPTPTMVLFPGSPARNAATGSTATTDQRGFPIVDTPDIGAYEAGSLGDYNAFIWESLPASANILQRLSTSDFDGDGASNMDEFLTGTVPADPASIFRPVVTHSAGSITLTFPTVAGRTYTLERSDTLAAGSWTNGGAFIGTGYLGTITVLTASPPRRFFRVAISR